MKESNGFVQEPMATPEEALPEEQQQQANNIASEVSPPESHEFSLAIKPKGTPLFKVRQVIFLDMLFVLEPGIYDGRHIVSWKKNILFPQGGNRQYPLGLRLH